MTFDGLTHDTTYAYQLIGLGDDQDEVFVSPELKLDTHPRVSGTFVEKSVLENHFELDVVLSEFNARDQFYKTIFTLKYMSILMQDFETKKAHFDNT